MDKCEYCDGTGTIESLNDNGLGLVENEQGFFEIDCPKCKGTGVVEPKQ